LWQVPARVPCLKNSLLVKSDGKLSEDESAGLLFVVDRVVGSGDVGSKDLVAGCW
jgi:hypothetical protein